MTTYARNKYVSISTTVLLLAITWVFSASAESLWSNLFLIAFIAGYTHFIVGGVFQYQAILRRGSNRELIHFWVLCGAAIMLWYVSWVFGAQILFLFSTLVVFMIHGALNEQTFLREYATVQVPPWISNVLVGMVGTLLLFLSFGHYTTAAVPSSDGVFAFIDFTGGQMLSPLVQRIFDITIVVGLIGATIYSLYHTVFGVGRSYVVLPTISLVACWCIYLFGPSIPYALVVYLILMYHFISWFELYFIKFYQTRRNQLSTYMLWHIYIIVPLVVITAWLRVSSEPPAELVNSFLFLFDMNVYLTVTFAHLLTSLLNEDWYRDRFLT